MQLSTSTSALDSNPLPLLPALAGSPAPGDTVPGTFADYMPSAESTPAPGAPLPAGSIPGGLIFALPAPLPSDVGSEISASPFAPTLLQANPDAAPACSACAALESDDEFVAPDSTPTESRLPASASPRASRALPASPPALRSTRALPLVEPSPAEHSPAAIPFTPAPAPTDASVVLPTALPTTPTPDPSVTVSDDSTDGTVADVASPPPHAARSPWIMPAAVQSGVPKSTASGSVASPALTPEAATLATGEVPPIQRPATSAGGASRFRASPLRGPASAPVAEATAANPPTSFAPVPPAPIPAPAVTAGRPTDPAAATFATAEIPVASSSSGAPASRVSSHVEKIAVALSKNSASSASMLSAPNKNFLTTEHEEVIEASASLGIDVAKSSATMTASSTLTHPAAPAAAIMDVNVVNAPTFSSVSTPSTSAATPAEITAAAHRAVDAALASTERLTSATQSSVNLQFSVGGEDLNVRVEIRGGAVHATFRTDSPELRTALAQEWQATNSQPADPSLRLAPPVFAASDRSAAETGAGFSGDQSSQARGQDARPNAEFALPGSARGRLASASSPGTADVSVPPSRSAPSTTVHLHAFA